MALDGVTSLEELAGSVNLDPRTMPGVTLADVQIPDTILSNFEDKPNAQEHGPEAPLTDANITGVQAALNDILSGAGNSRTSLGAQNTAYADATPEEKAKRKAEQAVRDAVFTETLDTLSTINTDPKDVKAAYSFLRNNTPPHLDNILTNAADILADPSIHDSDKQEAVIDATKSIIDTLISNPEFIEQHPNFENMSPEEQAAIAIEVMRETMIERLQSSERQLSPEEAKRIADQVIDNIKSDIDASTILTMHVEDLKEIAIANIKTQTINQQAETAAALTALATHAKNSVESGDTQALELSDDMIKNSVINFQHDYSESIYLEVYAGTSISEDGKTLTNDDSGEIKYYSADPDGSFYEISHELAIAQSPQDGAELAEQITNSGLQYDNLSPETQGYLAEELNLNSIEDITSYLTTTESSHPVLMVVMADEAFTQTVGSFALQTGIEKELANGQVFANDPRLEQLLTLSQDELIQQQQDAIAALQAQKDSYNETISALAQDAGLLNYFKNRADELENEIAQMQTQLDQYTSAVQQRAEAEATVAEAIETVNEIAAQQHAMDPDGIGFDQNATLGLGRAPMGMGGFSPEATPQDRIDYQMEIAEEAQAEADAAQKVLDSIEANAQETQTSAIETPNAPAPDMAQMEIDNNPALKARLLDLAQTTHISEEDLDNELQGMNIASPELRAQIIKIAQDNIGVNVAPMMTTQIVQNDGIGVMSHNRPPPTLTGNYNNAAMESDAVAEVAAAPTANANAELDTQIPTVEHDVKPVAFGVR